MRTSGNQEIQSGRFSARGSLPPSLSYDRWQSDPRRSCRHARFTRYSVPLTQCEFEQVEVGAMVRVEAVPHTRRDDERG
jgi:hypothetical protein